MLKRNGYGIWVLPATVTEADLARDYDQVVYNECGYRHIDTQRLADLGAEVCAYYSMCRLNPWDEENVRQNPIPRSEFDSHPQWLLRDMDAQPVMHGVDQPLTDVGAAGYRERYAEALLERLARMPAVRTVVTDDIWPWAEKVPDSMFPLEAYISRGEWMNRAWWPFFEAVIDALRAAGYRIIGNCAGTWGSYKDGRKFTMWTEARARVDVTIYESFSMSWFGSPHTDARTVDGLIESASCDPMEVWLSDTYYIPADKWDQYSELAMAMFLIALPQDGPPRSVKLPTVNDSYGIHPCLNLDIGEPLGPPAQIVPWEGRSVWTRQHQKGRCYLNYSPDVVTFRLTNVGYDYKGARLVAGDDLVMEPYTGAVLAYRRPA